MRRTSAPEIDPGGLSGSPRLLSQEGKPITALAPLGASARLAVDISGSLPATTFQLISMDAEALQTFAPALEQETATEKTYAAEITLPTAENRWRLEILDC